MTKFSTDEKIQAVMRDQNGSESVKSIAKSPGLHHTVLLNWIKQYEYHGDGNAVNEGVRYLGTDGRVQITTLDAPLVCPGEPRLLQFDQTFAPLDGGMHFNLHNNVWGTNFPMWVEGDAQFRFTLEWMK